MKNIILMSEKDWLISRDPLPAGKDQVRQAPYGRRIGRLGDHADRAEYALGSLSLLLMLAALVPAAVTWIERRQADAFKTKVMERGARSCEHQFVREVV